MHISDCVVIYFHNYDIMIEQLQAGAFHLSSISISHHYDNYRI